MKKLEPTQDGQPLLTHPHYDPPPFQLQQPHDNVSSVHVQVTDETSHLWSRKSSSIEKKNCSRKEIFDSHKGMQSNLHGTVLFQTYTLAYSQHAASVRKFRAIIILHVIVYHHDDRRQWSDKLVRVCTCTQFVHIVDVITTWILLCWMTACTKALSAVALAVATNTVFVAVILLT